MGVACHLTMRSDRLFWLKSVISMQLVGGGLFVVLRHSPVPALAFTVFALVPWLFRYRAKVTPEYIRVRSFFLSKVVRRAQILRARYASPKLLLGSTVVFDLSSGPSMELCAKVSALRTIAEELKAHQGLAIEGSIDPEESWAAWLLVALAVVVGAAFGFTFSR